MWPHTGVYAAATALIALGIYSYSLPTDLSWANAAQDGGELITASMTLGIPHPPGYPTYVVLGKLFSFLPVGSIALRYNLFSAVCMAAAMGLLVPVIMRLSRPSLPPVTAMAAALTLALTPLVWSQAVVAEVYALNMLFLSLMLLAIVRHGIGASAGVFFGLALTSHLTSLLMVPLLLFLPVRPNRLRLFAGMAAGLSPLLLLPVLAAGNSPVIWGDPTTLSDWWWLVSARLYESNFQWPIPNGRLIQLLHAIAFGPALLMAGKESLGVEVYPTSRDSTGVWRGRLILGGTAGLYVLFALLYQTPDAAVLLLPGLTLLMILLAPVLRPLWLGALIIPLAILLLVFPGQNRRNDPPLAPLVTATLAAAPENAILIAPGDRTIFTLWYYHHVEGNRPDLLLVDANLFAFDWYRNRLSNDYPDLWVPDGDHLDQFQTRNLNQYPLCWVGLVAPPAPAYNPQFVTAAGFTTPQLVCMEKTS